MINNSDSQKIWLGNGVATACPTGFDIVDEAHVYLILVDADGTRTNITSGYKVDKVEKKVLFPYYEANSNVPEEERYQVLQEGQTMIIYREVPIDQVTELSDVWPFNSIESGLDKLTMIDQQLQNGVSRSIKCARDVGGNFNSEFPVAAGKTIRINDAGTGFELTEDPAKVLPLATAEKNAAAASALSAQNAASVAQGAAATAATNAVAEVQSQLAETVATVEGYKNAASASATSAANQVTLAAAQVTLAANQVTLATEQKDLAKHWAEYAAGVAIPDKAITSNKLADNAKVYFNTVADMKAASLSVGQVVKTAGYYYANDGGAAEYLIYAKTTGDVDNKLTLIELSNGLVAKILYNENPYKILENISNIHYVSNFTITEENVQGSCYNGHSGRFLVGTMTNNATQEILEFDLNDFSITNRYNYTNLYHINTMSYVEDTKKIYVCVGSSGQWNKIAILNAETLAWEREITLNKSCLALGYDKFYKVFYSLDYYYDNNKKFALDVYDLNFNLLRTKEFDNPSPDKLSSNGIICDKGKVLVMFFDGFAEVNMINDSLTFINHKLPVEFESGDILPNGNILMVSNMWGAGLPQNQHFWEIDKVVSSYPAQVIPNNKIYEKYDLDQFVITGIYGVDGDTQAVALHFPPNTSNGILEVMAAPRYYGEDTTNVAYVRQNFYRIGDGAGLGATSWHTFTRAYNVTKGGWSNWVEVAKAGHLSVIGETIITYSAPSVSASSAWNTAIESFEAPADGILVIWYDTGSSISFGTVQVGINKYPPNYPLRYQDTIASNTSGKIIVPLSKGTTCYVQYKNVRAMSSITFIPYKSEEE